MIADKHTYAAITLLRHPTGGEVTMGAYVLERGQVSGGHCPGRGSKYQEITRTLLSFNS